MKIINTLLFSTAFFLLACGVKKTDELIEFKQRSFPEYESIVDHFFEDYSTRNMMPGKTLHFEKKPTGWYVSILDYNQKGEETLNYLFWDLEKEDYIKLDFTSSNPNMDQSTTIAQLKDPWVIRNFQLYPYYGYPGWDQDVIGLLEDRNDLSDSLLNALARSYRISASNLLSNNSGLVAEGITYDLPMTPNAMNEEQLLNYRKYSNLAITTYKRLVKQNPDFPVLIGAVETKLANEYVTNFLDLRMFQNEQEAEKELEIGIYSDIIIGVAKNSLRSCSKNAILFTAGDNDTYPLLYVQSQLGFRQDVLVINLSLLNTPRYINHLRRPILKAEPAPFSINAEQIKGDLRSFVYGGDNDSVQMEVADALAFILDENNSVSEYNGMALYQIPTRELKITSKDQQILFLYNDRYIYRSAIMALDIIATNQMERPIYFSNGNSNSSFMGLNSYLSYVGLTIELGTTVHDKQTQESLLYIDTAKLYQNLMYTYDFSGLDDINRQDERVLSNYSRLFHQLAEVLIIDKEEVKAQNVLNRWSEVIPKKRDYLDNVIPELIENFYEAGLTDQANELMDDFKGDLASLFDAGTREVLEENQIQLILAKLARTEQKFR